MSRLNSCLYLEVAQSEAWAHREQAGSGTRRLRGALRGLSSGVPKTFKVLRVPGISLLRFINGRHGCTGD